MRLRSRFFVCSVFSLWISSCSPFVVQAIFSPLNCFCTFVKKSVVFLWQYSYHISGNYSSLRELSWIFDFLTICSCITWCLFALVTVLYFLSHTPVLCILWKNYNNVAHNISGKLRLAEILVITVLKFFSYFTII